MRKTLSFCILACLFSVFNTATAQDAVEGDLYIYLNNKQLDVFPKESIKNHSEVGKLLKITLKNDSSISYNKNEIDSLGTYTPHIPQFTSFKFNNKYNENVYLDVFADIQPNEITASVGAIGKWLTPSFQTDDANAQVYINNELQESKVSRHRFDHPIHYIVGYPNQRIMEYVKTKDEIWSEGKPAAPILEQIPLTVDMLSTNAPSNWENSEGLEKMIDGNRRTFFHSTWGGGLYDPLPTNEHPYVQVDLNEAVSSFVLQYTTRYERNNYCPLEWLIQCSPDGVNWNDVRTLSVKDGLPTGQAGADYTSPLIEMNGNYRYLRFTMTSGENKNYLVLTEFSLHHYLGEGEATPPELISPAQYNYHWLPFGHNYEVKIDWLTDHATNVPRVDINIDGGGMVQDKVNYLKAQLTIDGAGVFPSMNDVVWIKGRGNSSWAGTGKSPYRLKFATSVKPFGLTKGKNWVLLANNQSNSMLTNAIGMKVARMVGTAGANDIVPIELYINGEYRGHYNFTQHVGLHNNSVDIDETNAVLLELDTYFDEPYRFHSSFYDLCTNIKDPDLDEMPVEQGMEKFKQIEQDFNDFCSSVYHQDNIDKWVNIPMLAKFLLVNELIQNLELNHPKSCFLYREDLLALHSKYVFGPVWDFDWAYGYEHSHQYCVSDPKFDFFQGLYGAGGPFFNALRYDSEAIKRAYYAEWKTFMEKHLDELIDFIDDYYTYAMPSLERNAQRWGDGYGYETVADRFKKWLNQRADYVFQGLEVYDLNTPLPISRGDVNKDGYITLADAVCVQNYLLGRDNETFDQHQADANESGHISIADVVWIVAQAMQEPADATRHMFLPAAEASMQPTFFTATVGTCSEMPMLLNITEGAYVAAQFDVTLPEGISLKAIQLPEKWIHHQAEIGKLHDGLYRIAIYSDNGTAFPIGNAELQLILEAQQNICEPQRVVSLSEVTLVSKKGEDERIQNQSTRFDMDVTGISKTSGTEAISGGNELTIDALTEGEVKIYTIDGRLVKICKISAGRHHISLPAGLYIINQQKVIINPM